MATVDPNKPRIRVRDATPADLERILDIFYDAFAFNTMHKTMVPNGPSASARANFGKSFFPDAGGEAPRPGPDGRTARKGERLVMVAELLDPEGPEDGPGDIVAFSRWTWNKEPREEWEWDVDVVSTQEQLGEGVNVELHNEFVGKLKRKERQYARGDPHLTLNILATGTRRPRLGAGSALVRWGLDLADEKGVPVFLESTPSGYPLYRRLGFEDLDVVDFELREKWNAQDDGNDWGTNSALELAGPLPEGRFRQVVMRRLPKT